MITAGDGEESGEEFQDLFASLREHHEPVGPIEGMLVEKIATSWWRLGRTIRAENGEIRKRQDTLSMDRALQNADKNNLALLLSQGEMSLFNSANPADAKVGTVERYSALQAMDRRLRENRPGLTYLSSVLELAKSQLASDGHLTEVLRMMIFRLFSSLDLPFALLCRDAEPLEPTITRRTSKRNTEKDRANDRALITGAIDQKLQELGALKEYSIERESLALDAEDRSCSLPPKEVSDTPLRYETHFDRQLYRAMDQLERLQRQRKGECVPPPLNVNLGRRA